MKSARAAVIYAVINSWYLIRNKEYCVINRSHGGSAFVVLPYKFTSSTKTNLRRFGLPTETKKLAHQ